MRKMTALLTVLALLASLLVGAVGAIAEDITLTVGASQNWIKDIDRELAQKFTDQTGIKIDFQVNPDDQYENIIKTKLATNEAPDIMYVGAGVTMQNFQPEKYFMDLGGMAWVPKMRDWAINGAMANGVLYGFNTWSVDGSAILYNTHIFEEYGLEVPNSFEELKAVCQVLLDNGVQPIYDNAKDNWHIGWWPNQLSSLMEAENPGYAELLNTNQLKLSDSPAMLQCMIDFKELYDLGYLGKNALANEWVPGYEYMGTGKAAMILTYTTYQVEVAEQYPESRALEWAMFPMQLAGCNTADFSAGGIVRAVNKATPYAEAVEQYFNFLVEEENVRAFYEARPDLGQPSVDGIEVRPLSNGYKTFEAYTVNGSNIVVNQAVKFWNEAVIGKAMQDMLAGFITPEECLQIIDDDRIQSLESSMGN